MRRIWLMVALIVAVAPVFAGCTFGSMLPNALPAPSLSFVGANPDDEYADGVFIQVQTQKQGTNHFWYEYEVHHNGVWLSTPTGEAITILSPYTFFIKIDAFKTIGAYEFRVRTKSATPNNAEWSSTATIKATVEQNNSPRTDGIWATIEYDANQNIVITYFTNVTGNDGGVYDGRDD